MWTAETRVHYDRSGLRYSHDLTNKEWAVVEPLIPPGKPGGNKRTVDIREVVNGLMYILGTGCQWRDIPRICLRKARSTIISGAGTRRGRWLGCITSFMWHAASWPDGRPAPRRR
jgi:transposase